MKVKITVEIDEFDRNDSETIPDLIVTMFGGMTPADIQTVTGRLTNLSARLDSIIHPKPVPKGARMAVPASLSAAISAINDDTNQLATVVTDLRSQIGVGMSQSDVDAVNAQLGAIATHLQGIAADPNNPVPPNPPASQTKTKKP